MASEIWSAILSGWPSVTDSEVNKKRSWELKLPLLLRVSGRSERWDGLMQNALILNKLTELFFTDNDLQRTEETSVSTEITLSRRVRYGAKLAVQGPNHTVKFIAFGESAWSSGLGGSTRAS